jgi:predicted transcriptional regulator
MNRLEYDTSQTGLRAIFKPWQETTLHTIMENPQGLNSRETWQRVNQRLGEETISRASIINFLEDIRQMGILAGEDRTGKGGHHWVYKPAMTEAHLKQFIAEEILTTLIRDFPEETKKSINKIANLYCS